MKKFLLVVLGLALTGVTANAFFTGVSNPPLGSPDKEYIDIVKSQTAGYSDAIAIGDVLSYDFVNVQDGYTVTRVGSNTVTGAGQVACVAEVAIATGDVSLHKCLVRGISLATNYSSPVAFLVGQKLCSNASGQAVACAACVNAGASNANDCGYGSATGNSVITVLQARNAGQAGTAAANTGLQVLLVK